MTTVEFRDRSRRAPGDGIRIFLGRTEKARELSVLRERRTLLQRLAKRGEYDVLQAIERRTTTVEAIQRLIDEHGVSDYRKHLKLSAAPNVPSLDDHVARFLSTIARVGTRRIYTRGLTYLQDYAVQGQRLGEREWHMVQLHNVQDAQVDLVARLKPATVKTYTSAWSAFFTWAGLRDEGEAAETHREPLGQSNPVRKARAWVTVRPTRQRFLLKPEYETLQQVCIPQMRAQYAALTLCGLRGGELRNLPPAHVHPTHIQVAPWGTWAPKGWPRVTRGQRNVPVHPTRLGPLLEEYREEWAGEFTFFVNPRTGHQWKDTAFRDQFNKDCQAAGLKVGSAGDGLTPHSCRHTFASWLAQDDVQLQKIALLMGDTVEMVTRYYAHLLPTDLDATVLRLFSAPVVQLSAARSRKQPVKSAFQPK